MNVRKFVMIMNFIQNKEERRWQSISGFRDTAVAQRQKTGDKQSENQKLNHRLSDSSDWPDLQRTTVQVIKAKQHLYLCYVKVIFYMTMVKYNSGQSNYLSQNGDDAE